MAEIIINSVTPTSNGTIRLFNKPSSSPANGFDIYVGDILIANNGIYDESRNIITSTPTENYDRYLFATVDIRVVETATNNIEWRRMSRTETIEVTTRYETDNALEQGKIRRVEGTPGIRTYTWEEKFVNGVTKNEKRNETSSITKNMTQTVIYEGTKTVVTPTQPAPQPSSPITNEDFFKIGNLNKVSDGLFKGTFDIRALSKIKFVANGLVITNAAMYDVDNVTQWFRAQEDIALIETKLEESNQLTVDQINALQALAQQNQAELEARATLDELSRLQVFLNDMQRQDEASREQTKTDLRTLANRVATNVQRLGEMKQVTEFMTTYISQSEEGMVIGKKDSTSLVKVSSDKISFVSGGEEVAYISQGVLHIDNGVFATSVRIGHFITQAHPDNEFINMTYFVP